MIHNTILGRFMQKIGFFIIIIICSFFFKVSAWLSNHAVCKIGFNLIRQNLLCNLITQGNLFRYILASATPRLQQESS
jgi:hypothetical protein